MPSSGPRNFTQQSFVKGLWIAGHWFHSAAGYYPGASSYALGDGSVLLKTMARTGIVQHRWLGGDAPLSMAEIDETFSFRVISETDYVRFVQHEQRGRSIELWLDVLIVDQWHIPSNTGLVFKTSRLLPWSLSGVTHATRPPRAFLESAAGVEVEQTIVTGTPSANEVKVPETGQVFGDIEIPSGVTEEFLLLRYHPILLAKISGIQIVHQGPNDIRFTARLQEVLSGVYTPAAAS
jgi:hypothetical protein